MYVSYKTHHGRRVDAPCLKRRQHLRCRGGLDHATTARRGWRARARPRSRAWACHTGAALAEGRQGEGAKRRMKNNARASCGGGVAAAVGLFVFLFDSIKSCDYLKRAMRDDLDYRCDKTRSRMGRIHSPIPVANFLRLQRAAFGCSCRHLLDLDEAMRRPPSSRSSFAIPTAARRRVSLARSIDLLCENAAQALVSHSRIDTLPNYLIHR